MQDSSSHLRQANIYWKSPPTTVPANASLFPIKRRGPGHPQKYAEPTETNRRQLPVFAAIFKPVWMQVNSGKGF